LSDGNQKVEYTNELMKDRSTVVWSASEKQGMLLLDHLTDISQQKQNTGSSMNRYLIYTCWNDLSTGTGCCGKHTLHKSPKAVLQGMVLYRGPSFDPQLERIKKSSVRFFVSGASWQDSTSPQK